MLADFLQKVQDSKSPEHSAMLKHLRDLVKSSREEMAKNYSDWDYYDQVFRSERKTDREDRAAAAKGQPGKAIVPLIFSQVMTFVAFNTAVLSQNRRFYELEPTGTEDNPLREPLELVLERDIRRNTWQTHLIQFFLDLGRFSLCCAEVGWCEETQMVKVTEEKETESAFGEKATSSSTSYQPVPTFCGNRIHPISPYKFFPDTRLPLTRYQEGEFCASEDDWAYSALQNTPGLFSLDKIPKFTEEMLHSRKKSSRMSVSDSRPNPNMGSTGATDEVGSDGMVNSGMVLITKTAIRLNPAKFCISGEEKLDSSLDFPLRFIAWVANDQTIVRFEEDTSLHGLFPYASAQFIPDQHRTVNPSLAATCDQLTSYITWLFNAHVTSQRNQIKGGKFILDPAGIDPKGLDSDSPYILLKKNASQTGVDRYIKQFTVQDPTINFMQDATGIKQLIGEVTGYNETMAGQYSSGRRSATADRVVASNGAARGKATLGSIWDTFFEPIGKQLIANNRSELSFEMFSRIVGKRDWPVNPDAVPTQNPMTGMPTQPPFTTEEIFEQFRADPVAIASGEDFFTFDATIPSEKAFLAQSLQEVLMMMLQSPQVAQMMGYGPEQFKALMQDIYNLRGVTPARLPAPTRAPTPQQGIIPMQQPEPSNSVAS